MVSNFIETTVEKVISGGDGLAHLPDGRVLFVPFSLPTERLRVSVALEKKEYAVGRIEDILEPYPERVEPKCKHYGICGGCQLQHVSYKGEIELKKELFGDVLLRQAGFEFEPEMVSPSPEEWEYRTKSEHPAAPHQPAPLIGYYQRRTHRVIDIKECPILDPYCFEDLGRIRKILGNSRESVYDELSGEGNLRHVILRRSSTGRRLIGLVTRTKELSGVTLKDLLEEFDDLEGIVQNVNPEPGNCIIGAQTEVISGCAHLMEEIGDLKLRVSFTSFFQANHSQAERIVQLVRDFLTPQSGDTICDAYAGVGMIGLAMAKDVKNIVAVESCPSAVADGRHNASINDLDNVNWIEAEAEAALQDRMYELIVLDPPRRGLTAKVISDVLDTRPRKICYVSCNPPTWARDIRFFLDAGYALKRLALLDMFPRTAHVELVSLLEI